MYIEKKINGLVWTIETRSATDAALISDGAMIRGITQCGKQLILLSGDLDQRTARLVILHELVHAYLWSTQARMPDEYTEEEVCEFVARWGRKINDTAEMIVTELF